MTPQSTPKSVKHWISIVYSIKRVKIAEPEAKLRKSTIQDKPPLLDRGITSQSSRLIEIKALKLTIRSLLHGLSGRLTPF
jgi:hypothetical protein